ncbi:hypothetical protein [Streptomyces sp. NPDC057382]|uniref:hypothetical protein n=1 Tax=unclassified Streptomyces TaxID=2593676 RepID=UPI00363C1730
MDATWPPGGRLQPRPRRRPPPSTARPARPAWTSSTALPPDTSRNRPQRTRDAYAADWKAWQQYCNETGLPPLAVRRGTLVLFVEWCWLQPGRRPGTLLAPTTIDHRLSGIVVTARRQHCLALPEDIAEEARALLQAKVKTTEKAGARRGCGPAPPCS